MVQSLCLIHTLAERTLLSLFSSSSSVYEVNFNTSFLTTSHPLFLVWKHVFITSSEICQRFFITMATVRCLTVLLPRFHLAQLCDSGRRTCQWPCSRHWLQQLRGCSCGSAILDTRYRIVSASDIHSLSCWPYLRSLLAGKQ